jgi:hypothetical protein
MSCNHQRSRSYWVDEFVNDWGDTEPGHWEYKTEYTTVDIDLHRYKCTMCNEVMYYSGRAKQYYEEGTKFDWIKGLDK